MTRSLRIAMVSKAIHPVRGGVELHVHSLARQLALQGHSIEVFISGKCPAPDTHYLVHQQVSIRQLVRHLRSGQFDAVHAHGARDPFSAAALTAGKRAGLQTVFTPHCFYPPHGFSGWLKRLVFDSTLGKRSLQSSRWIVCLTEQGLQDAVQQPGVERSHVCIVPNSIYWPEHSNPSLVQRLRAEYGRFLLCVGRLDRVKGGDFLIAAMAALPPDLRLVFIGPDNGAYQPWLRLAESLGLQPRVRFLMETDDETLYAAYQASLALIMASSYEGLPTVLLEAMAVGTPVVAANRGGIAHLIRHQENGFLYPLGDRQAFVACVEQILSGTGAMLAARAQEDVRMQYTWERNAQRIEALYAG